MTNLHSSKASGPDCIRVKVLKNCESELSHILAKLLNMYLIESCFPDCWQVPSVAPEFENVAERSTAINYRRYRRDIFLWVTSKTFQKLANYGLNDHLNKYDLFMISINVISSRSLADLLIVVSDKIARAFLMFLPKRLGGGGDNYEKLK